MVQRTVIVIVLIAIVLNNAHSFEKKVIENCTIIDLKAIDKHYELIQDSFETVNYAFFNCDIPILSNEFFLHVPNVRSIEFHNANISELEPFALSGLNQLEVLTIAGNPHLIRLKTYATTNLIHLHELNLYNNGIEILDTYALRRYTKLTQLDLDTNQIAEIPVGFFDFSLSIEILDLAGNALKRIDSFTFKSLLRLIDLNLAHNQITYIDPYAFTTTARLEILRLNGNRISTLGSMVFHNLGRLEFLNLSENALAEDGFEEDIFQENANLLHLDISHNSFSVIGMNALKGLDGLQVFNGSNNHLTLFPSSGLKRLTNLKFIDVSSNALTQLLEDQFTNMRSIEYMHLSRNQIDLIHPFAFRDLPNLKTLDLSRNHLDSWEFIENVGSLKILNLANNHFKHINLIFLQNIEQAILLENPWNCTWLIKAMAENHQMENIIFGLEYNEIIPEDAMQQIAEEIECKVYHTNETILKRIVFVQASGSEGCLNKAEKKKNAAINTYPRTFNKLLSDEFDYKAMLLWSLFAVCLVIGFIRLGRYCFDKSERKSEHYRLSQQEKSLKEYDDYFANYK